jgi:hypothetical protein
MTPPRLARADERGAPGEAREGAIEERLSALQSRLVRLEGLLAALDQRLDRATVHAEERAAATQAWVAEYVAQRMPAPGAEAVEGGAARGSASGGVLPGTTIDCTNEVLERLARVPVAFVRQMVAERVAARARAERVAVVDTAFFERAATF